MLARALTAALIALALAAILVAAPPARAVEAVNVRLDVAAIDLTAATELQKTATARTQVSTAPGPDGIVRRIEVRAREHDTNWAVFALTNNSDEQIDRLIVVPHYRMVGSGLFWPDLGLSRVVTITPSSGDRPVHIVDNASDIFRVTLDPGTVITFVAELRTDKLPQIYLWEPDAYKDKVNSFTLYHGIVIGIAGLLALFLTILFVVKGSVMFPAAAALGWAVLVYIGIDFGFWGKVFDMSAGAERDLARLRRGHPVGDAACVPVRIFESVALARALYPHHARLAVGAGRAGRGRGIRSGGRFRRCAHIARRDLGVWPGAGDLSLHPRLRPRCVVDSDLAFAGSVDLGRRPCRHRHGDQ